MFHFHYTEAIVSRIPDSLVSGVKNGVTDGDSPKKKDKKKKKKVTDKWGDPNEWRRPEVDLERCRQELNNLVNVLREMNIDVVEMDEDNTTPLTSFVGDLAFVLMGIGLAMKPRTFSWRKTEVETLRTVLKKELDLPIVHECNDPAAFIEGPDILFTGRELFVGISNYTNLAGARFVASTFPEIPCTTIKVPDGDSHLTHYVNMGAPDIIIVGNGPDSQDVIKRMEREASFQYQTITLPEDKASTVLFLNGTLLHLSQGEIPFSFRTLTEKLSYLRKKSVDLTELSKVCDCPFNRLLVLLKKPRKKKPLP